MRKLSVIVVVALASWAILAAPSVALAQADQQAVAQTEKEKKKAANKRVCRYVRETGSRIRERICRKQKDWDRIEEQAREDVDRAYEGSNRNTTGGDT